MKIKPVSQNTGCENQRDLFDFRFRALLSPEDWAVLPEPIRKRFSKHLARGQIVLYAGKLIETRLSVCGWIFAQLARLIGGPLPFEHLAQGPAIVTVTEDPTSSDQIWTRVYPKPGHFPQVIHSKKRFCGPTGLEEYVGRGVGMSISVSVIQQALVFRSERYFFQFLGYRIPLPKALTPGLIQVTHREEGEGIFSFTLSANHPLFGLIIRQTALFKEVIND